MTATKTEELGAIWTATAGDDLGDVRLGDAVSLGSAHRRVRGMYLGRSWYILGHGMLTWTDADIQRSLDLCIEYLQAHGYRCVDLESGEYAR